MLTHRTRRAVLAMGTLLILSQPLWADPPIPRRPVGSSAATHRAVHQTLTDWQRARGAVAQQRGGLTVGVVQQPAITTFGVGTSVLVPDGGTALLGSYATRAEGRNEFGAPILGRVPVAGRPFRNTGYGYSTQTSQVSVRVRIIDLAEEELRQTGYSSRGLDRR
jgi:type II secretory pathway component GspD/PulD (secretin)